MTCVTVEEGSTPEVISYRVRAGIIRYLECAASPEEQVSYEENLLSAGAPVQYHAK